MIKETKIRNNKIDNIKGILIILTVLAHMLITYKYVEIGLYSKIVQFIYVFHMPLFFIIAGEMSKRINKKRIYYYIVLFLLMQGMFLIYDYFTNGSFSFFNIEYSSWYILLLIIYRIIFSCKKISKIFDLKYSILVVFSISLISGFLPINIIFLRFFYFLFFFLFGYKNNIKFNKENLSILLLLVLAFILVISSVSRLNLLMGDRYVDVLEIFVRMVIIVTNVLLYYLLDAVIIDKKIPLITKAGVYSLFIYILHRIPTLLLSDYLYIYIDYIFMAILISIIICIIIVGLAKYIKIVFQSKMLYIIVLIIFGYLFVTSIMSKSELSPKVQSELDDCVSIGFIGDLILLEDQLKNSNNNFDYLFDNMSGYFEDTDYMISVLEGPVDDDSDYSYGNFDDGKELRLNYPTSFLKSIKDANINLVSIANNHMLDRGEKTYKNTISNLNKYNLDYVGEKNNYKIVDVKGLKIGILAYSYGSNYDEDKFKDIFNYLIDPFDEDIEKVKNMITNDFNNIKKENVDLIIVMPHYGTQFSEMIDVYQEYYNRLFVSLGANIILGDHAHTIQPIYYYDDSIIINCPGNYINSYIDYNGDISMFVKVYIDKDKKIKGSSITPIIAEKNNKGLYYPVTMEMKSNKVERAKSIISSVIFHKDIKEIKNTYYYLKDKQYKYENSYRFKITDSDKKSLVYQKIDEHNKICFIGDSITEGTKNNYHPWYEKLMSYFPNKDVVNISKGSFDTNNIIDEFSDKIANSNCDLNIINIGTNDIRYYSRNVNDYINNIKKIISYTSGEVIILAPWQTTNRDYNISKNDTHKRNLYNIYNNELQKIEKIYYVNPNNYIEEVMNYNDENNYLIDGIHPNDNIGVDLYSFSVLRSN